MTRGYEALIILKSAGSEQEIARVSSQVDETVKKTGGRIETSQNLGRRRLAFRIGRQAEGYYQLIRFQASTDQIVELERLLKLNDAIVRFMVLNAEELGTPLMQFGSGARPAPAEASSR